MLPAISITIDKAKMRAVERAAVEIPRALPRIMVRSLERTAAGGRTQIDREIRAELTVKQKAVRKRIVDEDKPTTNHWVYRLGISNTRLSLMSFKYSWSKRKGVTYSVRKGQEKNLPHGFVAPGFWHKLGGYHITHKTIFRRAERGDFGFSKGTPTTHNPNIVRRMPLKSPRGPSLGQVLNDAPALLRKVERTGSQRLEKEVYQEINYRLQRRWPK